MGQPHEKFRVKRALCGGLFTADTIVSRKDLVTRGNLRDWEIQELIEDNDLIPVTNGAAPTTDDPLARAVPPEHIGVIRDFRIPFPLSEFRGWVAYSVDRFGKPMTQSVTGPTTALSVVKGLLESGIVQEDKRAEEAGGLPPQRKVMKLSALRGNEEVVVFDATISNEPKSSSSAWEDRDVLEEIEREADANAVRTRVRKKKLQVFISSTFTDMQAERQAVVEAVLRAGHIPAGMELFAAGDESQLDVIRRWIDDSDVFVLILGGRYGTIEKKSGKSYVQLEYEYAQSVSKPYFAAVMSDQFLEAKVRSAGTSAVDKYGAQLAVFREEVTQKISRFFSDLNELKLVVFESLGNCERDAKLIGWIRASDVVDPKATLEEIERLRQENIQLRERVQQVEVLGYGPAGQSATAIASQLGHDAKSILTAGQKDGTIAISTNPEGPRITAGGDVVVTPNGGHRQTAHWQAVIDELQARRLIELKQTNSKNWSAYNLTKLGYDVADALASA